MTEDGKSEGPARPKRPAAMEKLIQGRAAAAPAPAREGEKPASAETEPSSGSPGAAAEFEIESLRGQLEVARQELIELRPLGVSHRKLIDLLQHNAELLIAGDPETLPGRVLQIALELVEADRAAIFRLSKKGALEIRLVRPENVEFSEISRSVVRDAIVEKRSVLHQGSAMHEGAERQSAVELDLQTVVATPLVARDRHLGVLYLDSKQGGRLGSADMPILEIFSKLAAAAMLRLEELQQVSGERRVLAAENRELKIALVSETRLDNILAASPQMMRVIDQIQRMARFRSSVVIHGESGTGKELVARALHNESPWADKPFKAINCAAMPDNLLESELFGHMQGAFTGADRDKAGLFEEVDGGTLFLDEIGDMSSSLQVKLLRVTENGEVRRVSSTESKEVDVRIISASHANLTQMVDEGSFREDLFYRLNVLTIEIPPLRERPEDVLLLAEFFLKKYATLMKVECPKLTPGAARRLQANSWPGNVRQLEKSMERTLALRDESGSLKEEELLLDIERPGRGGANLDLGSPNETLKDFLGRMEREKLEAVMQRQGGRVTAAAKSLGISRQYLHRKLKEQGFR